MAPARTSRPAATAAAAVLYVFLGLAFGTSVPFVLAFLAENGYLPMTFGFIRCSMTGAAALPRASAVGAKRNLVHEVTSVIGGGVVPARLHSGFGKAVLRTNDNGEPRLPVHRLVAYREGTDPIPVFLSSA